MFGMSSVENRGKIVIVTGVPGVGKTTVLNAALELCRESRKEVSLLNYGNVMFEEASRRGLVKARDEMRHLPVKTQIDLQLQASETIRKAKGNVIVDTHMFINTPKGYMPGIPSWVAESLKPDAIVLLEAEPEEISKRRRKDAAIRVREADSPERITEHQMMGRFGAAAISVQTGCTVVIAKNKEGGHLEAAKAIASLFEGE
ncbi:MAG: Adenylate kinase, archaeal type [Candidatus Methanosuratincola subterraneus]|uniref:Adenylate kinase n=2 Tax=Candidatus Methanosuratincola (ex Vanwonterghem et al. 2016) TaxID=1915412 RepID=A0A444L7L2_METS7|nr:MAG: Adenylate kinase, archaeal type [Candidatus Methanosuratincola subterraneus]